MQDYVGEKPTMIFQSCELYVLQFWPVREDVLSGAIVAWMFGVNQPYSDTKHLLMCSFIFLSFIWWKLLQHYLSYLFHLMVLELQKTVSHHVRVENQNKVI